VHEYRERAVADLPAESVSAPCPAGKLLDRILITGERHLVLVLREYVIHDNRYRIRSGKKNIGPNGCAVPPQPLCCAKTALMA